MVGWIVLGVLALCGCAAVIRRLCLWFTRCPSCAVCCRLAVPRDRAALAPLVRCLQGQMAWEDTTLCRCTLVLLPEGTGETSAEMDKIFGEAPGVIPVHREQLSDLIAWMAEALEKE